MYVNEMTRKDFAAVPWRENYSDKVECDFIVILPQRSRHDSGYRNMDFVACRDNEPVCRLSGCSDVIHVDGTGGYGYNWLAEHDRVPDGVRPSGWSIDCLPKSGLLRMWSTRGHMVCAGAFSSFEIFAKHDRGNK